MVLILDEIQQMEAVKREVEVRKALTATPFYDSDLPTALNDAQAHIHKNGGSLAPTPILMQGRIMAPEDNEIHTNWYTAFTENFGTLDKEGNFAGRGEPVAVTAHGAVILSFPERIRQAYNKGLDNYAAKITPEEGQAVLHGDFEGDHEIFAYEQFEEATADKRFWYDNLGKRIIVVRPLAEAQKLQSGRQSIRDEDNNLVLAQHPELIIQTGGIKHAKDYTEYAENRFKTDMLNVWHNYVVDRARLVFLYDSNDGIDGYGSLSNGGRFAAVAPEAQELTRSAAPEIKGPTLDDILSITRKFTPEINQEALEQELGTLYD